MADGLAVGWLARGEDGLVCVATGQPTRQQLLLAMQARGLYLQAYDVVIVGHNDPVPVERLWAAMSNVGGPSAVGSHQAGCNAASGCLYVYRIPTELCTLL